MSAPTNAEGPDLLRRASGRPSPWSSTYRASPLTLRAPAGGSPPRRRSAAARLCRDAPSARRRRARDDPEPRPSAPSSRQGDRPRWRRRRRRAMARAPTPARCRRARVVACTATDHRCRIRRRSAPARCACRAAAAAAAPPAPTTWMRSPGRSGRAARTGSRPAPISPARRLTSRPEPPEPRRSEVAPLGRLEGLCGLRFGYGPVLGRGIRPWGGVDLGRSLPVSRSGVRPGSDASGSAGRIRLSVRRLLGRPRRPGGRRSPSAGR